MEKTKIKKTKEGTTKTREVTWKRHKKKNTKTCPRPLANQFLLVRVQAGRFARLACGRIATVDESTHRASPTVSRNGCCRHRDKMLCHDIPSRPSGSFSVPSQRIFFRPVPVDLLSPVPLELFRPGSFPSRPGDSAITFFAKGDLV
jgi:hypothetical protein